MKRVWGCRSVHPARSSANISRALEIPRVGFSAGFTTFALGEALGGRCATWEIS